MAWTKFQTIIVIVMVSTGTLNTISAGFQQRALGNGINSDGTTDWEAKPFDHPYVQAMGMMCGETLCMLAYLIYTRFIKKPTEEEIRQEREQNFNPLILWPAAMLDLIGTCANYVGMILSYPSSFQMLRGSVIVFTALLSIFILGKRPKLYQWIAIVIIIGGLVTIGLGDELLTEDLPECEDVSTGNGTTTMSTTTVECKAPTKLGSNPLLGDIIIVAGEVFHALQFIYEEYFLTKYTLNPLKVVGYEGIFGFLTITVALWPMYFITVGETFGLGPNFRFEDAIDAFTEIASSGEIFGWTIGNMFSIACFNFAGVSVTKELSSTTRAVLDNIRQIFIWAFSLIPGIEWQEFVWTTPVGFVILIVGIWLYNDVIIRPLFYMITGKKKSDKKSSSTEGAVESS